MKLCILGAGSWGIALADHLQRSGHDISLWEFNPENVEILIRNRENPILLPGVQLHSRIFITGDIEKALSDREGVVLAVPSHAMRSTVKMAAKFWLKKTWALCASKGLEEETNLRMSQVLEEILSADTPIGVLSGPSHAEEVSRRIPTTVVTASSSPQLSETIQKVFHAEYFRVYTCADVSGVELGGSLKNIIAIAAGILDGMGLGDNTKAALITRGLHEMTRLGVALGAQSRTFAGLAGMGDLIVTCISHFSRNRLLGEKIGKGATLEQALKEMVMVVEGIKTCKAALSLAKQTQVEMPITGEVYKVLFNGKSAKDAVFSLLSRSAKPEQDFLT